MPNKWRTNKSPVHDIRLHGRRKERLNLSREKKQGKHRRRKVDEKSCVAFILCHPGWYVHKPDVQNKWEEKTHIHTLFVTSIIDAPLPWEGQCEWHRMTEMTGPDCAVMCNLINTHTHTQVSLIPPWEDQCEWRRMTINRMTGPDCAVMCNLINTHTHTFDPPLGGSMRVA